MLSYQQLHGRRGITVTPARLLFLCHFCKEKCTSPLVTNMSREECQEIRMGERLYRNCHIVWNGIRVIIHHSLHKLHVSYFIRFTTFTLQSPIHKLHHSIHKVSYSLYKVLYPIYNIQNSLYKVQSINFTS